MVDRGGARRSARARGRWIHALAGGVLVVGAVGLLFRQSVISRHPTELGPGAGGSAGLAASSGFGPATVTARALRAEPQIELHRIGGPSADPLLSEDALLFDPIPLFLPTRWNSSTVEKKLTEPGGTFPGFPPMPAFLDGKNLGVQVPWDVSVPSGPAGLTHVLAGDPPGRPFLGFGRARIELPVLPARTAFVEVADARGGETVFQHALNDTHPPGNGQWGPMEFMAAVDAAGLVGALIPTVRSGSDEVDAYFRHYLADSLRLGQRLAPGFYRISVGP